MEKLPAPKQICRVTFDQLGKTPLPNAGIYIVAYMHQILYIGKAKISVSDRLRSHMVLMTRIGRWLRMYELDWENVRLDVLEIPDGQSEQWLFQAENVLVKVFKPLFNSQLQPSKDQSKTS